MLTLGYFIFKDLVYDRWRIAGLEPLLAECRKVIVGQTQLLNRLLVALLCRGHVLLEGLPGLAKTRTIKTLALVDMPQFKQEKLLGDADLAYLDDAVAKVVKGLQDRTTTATEAHLQTAD